MNKKQIKFIKLLKEYVNTVGNDYYDYRDMLKKIDKLAGEELTEDKQKDYNMQYEEEEMI